MAELEIISSAAQPIDGMQDDYDKFLQTIGDRRIVLMGDTHGTHEFYWERARLTQRLIQEKGFTAVAVEADWPDAYWVNQYIWGINNNASADEALSGFKRFPTWMWRNTDVLEFVDWMRQYSQDQQESQQIGFYGLDLYSLHTSMSAVIQYLDEVDPKAAKEARYRYGCFDNFGEDLQDYGFFAWHGLSRSCQDEVVRQLIEIRNKAWAYLSRDGSIAEEALFNAEQNARLAKNAEQCYRSLFAGRVNSWNLRDTHMAETLGSLLLHLAKSVQEAKMVIWTHNFHIGDTRATDMGRAGELNIGQLVRQQYGEEAFSIGFSTYTGTVTAASGWGGPAELKKVCPALPGSYENLFHQVGISNFVLYLRDPNLRQTLHHPLLERAIGVIYLPQTERKSHYFRALITDQFDAVIHFDTTRAVEPLERNAKWVAGEVPETYPSAL
jgi:erythromycin esterase-like protein